MASSATFFKLLEEVRNISFHNQLEDKVKVMEHIAEAKLHLENYEKEMKAYYEWFFTTEEMLAYIKDTPKEVEFERYKKTPYFYLVTKNEDVVRKARHLLPKFFRMYDNKELDDKISKIESDPHVFIKLRFIYYFELTKFVIYRQVYWEPYCRMRNDAPEFYDVYREFFEKDYTYSPDERSFFLFEKYLKKDFELIFNKNKDSNSMMDEVSNLAIKNDEANNDNGPRRSQRTRAATKTSSDNDNFFLISR